MPRCLITTNIIKCVFGDFGLYIIFRAELDNRPEKDRDIQTDRQTDRQIMRSSNKIHVQQKLFRGAMYFSASQHTFLTSTMTISGDESADINRQ